MIPIKEITKNALAWLDNHKPLVAALYRKDDACCLIGPSLPKDLDVNKILNKMEEADGAWAGTLNITGIRNLVELQKVVEIDDVDKAVELQGILDDRDELSACEVLRYEEKPELYEKIHQQVKDYASRYSLV
jgi:hypothetical protein